MTISPNGHHYDCPVCGKPMERRTTAGPGTSGIGVEICERCLGVWLPASSVRQIADPRAAGTLAGAFGIGLRFIVRSIERMLYTDALTGVRNRRGFDLQLPAAIREANGKRNVSLLFIDLDGFKQLNDTHGHQAGDAALRAFAQALARLLRPMDHVARYGGDEFAAILPDADRAAAHATAVRIVRSIEAARIQGLIPVGASVGIATYPEDGATAEALVAAADAEMYRAKRERAARVSTLRPAVVPTVPRPTPSALIRRPPPPGPPRGENSR